MYEEKTAAQVANLASTSRSTDEMYKEKKNWDFSTALPKAGVTGQAANGFTSMVWRASTEVGFAVRGKYVYAAYCAKGPDPIAVPPAASTTTATLYKLNV